MTELERTLVELGRGIEYPATPDLAPRVRAALASQPRPRRPARRPLAIAVAVAAVALAATLAVPQTRAAILELLGIGGVTVERVGELPPVEPRGAGYLGLPVAEADARVHASYRVRLPALDGLPEPRFFFRSVPTETVTAVYGDADRPRLVFTQFRARVDQTVVMKELAGGTDLERVRVGGSRGLWLSGKEHAFRFVERDGLVVDDAFYLASNTLIWERGGITYRLEADVSKEDALVIAESVR